MSTSIDREKYRKKEWYEQSLRFEHPKIDDVLHACIDQLWEKYDDDNSGYLDKDETRVFIKESIEGLAFEEMTEDEKDLSDQAFEACFDKIDTDQNGVIDKDEMMEFIKLATGLTDGLYNQDGSLIIKFQDRTE